jgi:hypothetical protein
VVLRRRLTAIYAKNTSAYRDFITVATVDDTGAKEMYINADIEYKAADSMIISAARRGCFETPRVREVRRMRVAMTKVEMVVVATDNEKEES